VGYPSPEKLYSNYDIMKQFDDYPSDLFSVGVIGLEMYYLDSNIKEFYVPDSGYSSYENVKLNERKLG
jgi:hypothetical protein